MIHIKIHQIVKIVGFVSVIGIASISLTNTVATAQDETVLSCVQGYRNKLGISPDAALAECKRNTIIECIKVLTGKKVVAKAVSSTDKGYLIDLGDIEARWLEGHLWKEKDCKANTLGPYRRQSDRHRTFWSNQRSYEWFRQGFCSQPEIELDQNYSLNEAKTLCELSPVNELSPVDESSPMNDKTGGKGRLKISLNRPTSPKRSI